MLEAVSRIDGKNDECAGTAARIKWNNRPEALLAGCVPNVELDWPILRVKCLRDICCADGRLAALVEFSLDQLADNAALADSRVPDEDNLQHWALVDHLFFLAVRFEEGDQNPL